MYFRERFLFRNYTAIKPEECPTLGSADVLRRVPGCMKASSWCEGVFLWISACRLIRCESIVVFFSYYSSTHKKRGDSSWCEGVFFFYLVWIDRSSFFPQPDSPGFFSAWCEFIGQTVHISLECLLLFSLPAHERVFFLFLYVLLLVIVVYPIHVCVTTISRWGGLTVGKSMSTMLPIMKGTCCCSWSSCIRFTCAWRRFRDGADWLWARVWARCCRSWKVRAVVRDRRVSNSRVRDDDFAMGRIDCGQEYEHDVADHERYVLLFVIVVYPIHVCVTTISRWGGLTVGKSMSTMLPIMKGTCCCSWSSCIRFTCAWRRFRDGADGLWARVWARCCRSWKVRAVARDRRVSDSRVRDDDFAMGRMDCGQEYEHDVADHERYVVQLQGYQSIMVTRTTTKPEW